MIQAFFAEPSSASEKWSAGRKTSQRASQRDLELENRDEMKQRDCLVDAAWLKRQRQALQKSTAWLEKGQVPRRPPVRAEPDKAGLGWGPGLGS